MAVLIPDGFKELKERDVAKGWVHGLALPWPSC